MSRKQTRKVRLELETLEARDHAAALSPAGALVSTQPAPQGASSPAAAPSPVSLIVAALAGSSTDALPRGGIHGNHNETLLRLGGRRRRTRS